jgi:hypothetical protein
MPGANAKSALFSYVAVGKETTYGTYASATTAIEALSCSFKTERKSEKLEQLYKNRGYVKRVLLDKNVAGSLDMFLHPDESALVLANALGGAVVSTASGTAYNHSMSAGNYDTTTAILSLSFNVRKGDEHVQRFMGGKVNTLKISGQVGEVIKMSADIIFKDSTTLADDISTALSVTAIAPYTFIDGVFRYTNAEASLTSTVEEKIQGFELTINNNLKPEEGRELGSMVLSVLPATRRSIELKITQRFDTTTTLDRHLSATIGAAELFFTGESITAEHGYEMRFRFPKLYQNSADPELGGPEDILKSEISYDVMVDSPNTTTGKDIGVTVVNTRTAY